MTDQPQNPSGAGPHRTPGIDYPTLVQDALRKVVRDVLAQVADFGLPGDHHFYLGFATGHEGVGLSAGLRAQHPDQMTIVLQHDYRDLEVDDEGFDVTLRFGGVPQGLRVPFAALTSFYDPAVQFMLRFEPEGIELVGDEDDGEDDDVAPDAAERAPTSVLHKAARTGPRPVPAPHDDGDERPAGEVVSIEAFRRK